MALTEKTRINSRAFLKTEPQIHRKVSRKFRTLAEHTQSKPGLQKNPQKTRDFTFLNKILLKVINNWEE